jgi:hypothetical protein
LTTWNIDLEPAKVNDGWTSGEQIGVEFLQDYRISRLQDLNANPEQIPQSCNKRLLKEVESAARLRQAEAYRTFDCADWSVWVTERS